MHKRSNVFWGTILIVIAALLLLRQFGIIQGDIFGFFWPLAVIALGIWLISGYFIRRQPSAGELVSIPLEGATSAQVKINHGAGRLIIGSGAGPSELLNGNFGYGVNQQNQREADRLVVKLRPSQEFWPWWPGERMEWNLRLNPDITMSLKIDSGASASTLDLSGLKVTDLDIDTGASSTDLTLPALAGSTHAEIDTGASSLTVTVPEGVAASIRVKSGIAAVTVSSRFPRQESNLYQSPDYSTAANRVDLTISSGVGTVDVK